MTVFINGVFDVLTPGHFNLLMFAKHLTGSDGKLIVAVDEDEKVMADKGLQRPIFNVHERAKALLDLWYYDRKRLVDVVHFFHTNLELEMMIKRIRPDYIVKGSDWVGKTVIGSDIAKVAIFDRMLEYSTTETIRRCQEKK